jgi:hypothetical protein
LRDHADWRGRALALARHAAAAAGVGIGWLLLSGAAATAAPGTPDDLVGAVLSAPATATSGTGAPNIPGPVTMLTRTTAPLTSDPVGTAADLSSAASGSSASGLRALPAAVEPITEGPLRPLSPVLAPVVTGTAGALGGTVEVVGGAAQTVADAGSAVLSGPLLPAGQLGAPAADVPADAAPALAEGAASETPAGGPVDSGSSADVVGTIPDASAGVLARALFAGPILSTAVPVGAAFQTAPAGAPVPGFPEAPALPLAAVPSGGGLFSLGGDASGLAALAAAAFTLSVAWRAGPLGRARTLILPAAPAFDPGSTPD